MMPKLRRLLILAAMFSLACAAAAAQDRVQLPELITKRLLNDLQVTVAPTPYLGDGLTLGLVIRYGAAFDPAGKGGLANLVSRMFLKATNDRNQKDIEDELAYLGASIEVKCNWDGFRFLLKGDSSKYERALLLLYQVAGEAQFDEKSLAAAKQSILQDLKRAPDPRTQIHRRLLDVLYNGTNNGRPLEGTQASVSSITLGDVRHFYKKYFSPGQASLEIVGDIQPRDVMQKVSRIWGVWVREDDIPFTFNQPRNPAGRKIFVMDDPNSPAAQFIIGGFFPAREDPGYINALLAARILQERLTKLLPTSLLTVGSEGRRMWSPFYIQGQAAAEQAVDEIEKIQDAIEEMKKAPVSDEELNAAKAAMTDEHNRDMTSTDGLCNFLLDAELYRLGSNYTTLMLYQIQRCNKDMIKQAANEWIFPGGEILLIRGPADTLKPLLSPLGSFQPLTP